MIKEKEKEAQKKAHLKEERARKREEKQKAKQGTLFFPFLIKEKQGKGYTVPPHMDSRFSMEPLDLVRHWQLLYVL